jgi:hypothetical protein
MGTERKSQRFMYSSTTIIRQLLEQVQANVVTWPGIEVAPHRFGGTEFTVGNVEIGHFHRNGMIDILYSKAIRQQLIAEGKAELHHLLPDTGWISFYIRSEADVQRAIWLFRYSYVQKLIRKAGGVSEESQQIINDLAPSESLRRLVEMRAPTQEVTSIGE